MTRTSWIAFLTALLLAAPALAQGKGKQMKLEDFVSQNFFHGLPYDEAVAYGPSAVPKLIKILKDPQQESKWSIAVSMLAMIGDERGLDAVFEFIKQPGEGEVTPSREWARGNAVMALGYSANKGRSKKALRYLQEGVEPGAWKNRGVRGAKGKGTAKVRKRGDEDAEGEEQEESIVDERLSELALLGLALSGTPEGKAALEKRRDEPGLGNEELDMLTAAIEENEKIGKQGVGAYDKERRARVIPKKKVRERGVDDEGAIAPDEGLEMEGSPLPDTSDEEDPEEEQGA
jgi:HEAT repeat protein